MKTRKLALKVGEGLNTHTLESDRDIDYEQLDKEIYPDTFKLLINSKGQLTHEEHGQINLKAGEYISCTQVEFDPLSNQIRGIFD